jgi:hypothetical protein
MDDVRWTTRRLGRYTMRELNRFTCLLLGILVLGVSVPLYGQDTPSCEEDPARRALDFWIGEWEVVDADGRALGTNRIETSQNGCMLRERWESADGGTGQSLNYFDPAEGVWRQNWVDSSGGIVDYEGGVEGGVLRYEGRHVRPDGTVLKARVVLEPVEGGRLRHLIELSSDQGATWSTHFDGTYLPRGGQIVSASGALTDTPATEVTAEPVENEDSVQVAEGATSGPTGTISSSDDVVTEPEVQAVDPEPAKPARVEALPVAQEASPEPAAELAQPQAARQAELEGSSVRATTRELQREEIPEEQAPELVMASPMVLEIVPADIGKYPENAAWRTEETAGFICNEVKIRRVGVGRQVKGDRVRATVTAMLYTKRRMRKVGLLIEAVHDGEVIAADEIANIRVGKNIPAHGNDGMDVTAELEVSRQQFDAMFAGDSRPVLRLTLSCPAS